MWLAEFCTLQHIPRYNCCMEVCLDTAMEHKELRLHIQAFLDCNRRLHFKTPNPVVFENSVPMLSKEFSTCRGSSRKCAIGCGHYYYIGPKVGSLFKYGTHVRTRQANAAKDFENKKDSDLSGLGDNSAAGVVADLLVQKKHFAEHTCQCDMRGCTSDYAPRTYSLDS